MPVNLSIKGVPDAVAAALRARATNHHRSLQRELMAIVEAAARTPDAFDGGAHSTGDAAYRRRHAGQRLRPIEEISAELRKLFPHPFGGPSSTEIVRAMRDSRYGVSPDPPRRKRRSR